MCNMTIARYNGAEICKLIGLPILDTLTKLIKQETATTAARQRRTNPTKKCLRKTNSEKNTSIIMAYQSHGPLGWTCSTGPLLFSWKKKKE